MRLTVKNKTNEIEPKDIYFIDEKANDFSGNNQHLANQKLGQLEDIEEEFEIESIEDLRDRLTKYKFLANHEMSCVDVNAYNLMLEDLNKYHSIEEELGIDLVTLVKALTDGIWYKKEEHSLHTELCLNANKEWVIGCWLTKYECAYCSLKDYGKTWALTKEELL